MVWRRGRSGVAAGCALWAVLAGASPAAAWGFEGHKVVAMIARSYLTPRAKARVDEILAGDPDTLTGGDMAARATWADVWRNTHRETASWHFVDIELDHPDLAGACFGFPATGQPASAGPAQDCLVDRLEAFAAELGDPATAPAERELALKFVLHFAGDLHQPLHASDNHDQGGNCVRLSLGGPRTVNLHGYWDRTVVEALGTDAETVAAALRAPITPALRQTWATGDPRAWARESFEVVRRDVYTVGSKPGCGSEAAPVDLPVGYADRAQAVAAVQLEKAGVRLAVLLNRGLDPH